MKLQMTRIILFTDDVLGLATFYQKVIGLKLLEICDNEKWAQLSAGGCNIAIHHRNRGGKQTTVKLVFGTNDVLAARAELTEAGLKFGKLHELGDIRFCDTKDPAGNPIQISNRP